MKRLTLSEVARAMPAETFGFKPNPEEMKFGEVMAQIAQANASAFSLASGQKSPLTRPAKLDKDALIQYTMAGMSDADSSKMVGPEGKQLTAGETPDKPPTYRF